MVAYAEPRTERQRPMDTGAVFDGRVRVWLMTDNPLQAGNLGAQLRKMGLPIRRQLVQKATCTGIALPMGTAAGKDFTLILETTDPMDATRFVNWLKLKQAPAPPPKKPGTLQGLLEAGEIETFDAT